MKKAAFQEVEISERSPKQAAESAWHLRDCWPEMTKAIHNSLPPSAGANGQ